MPYAVAKDNVRLYFEEAGSGTPIIFLHEFAADHTNWEPQIRYFSRGHRCIAYSARGYTPSDVPPTADVLGIADATTTTGTATAALASSSASDVCMAGDGGREVAVKVMVGGADASAVAEWVRPGMTITSVT